MYFHEHTGLLKGTWTKQNTAFAEQTNTLLSTLHASLPAYNNKYTYMEVIYIYIQTYTCRYSYIYIAIHLYTTYTLYMCIRVFHVYVHLYPYVM